MLNSLAGTVTHTVENAMTTARSAVGAPPPWCEAMVDGIRLAYSDAGRGPTVVCLHAIGHGARDFEPLRGLVGGAWRLIGLDWPGHGNSAADRLPASAGRYAQILGGFLEAIGVDRCVLLGNSIGGAAAMRLAAEQPQRVRGVILENPGGLEPVDRLARIATAAMARFFAAGARGARWYPAVFAAYYRMVLQRGAAAEQRRRIIGGGSEVAPVLVEAWRSFGQPDADLRPLVPSIGCPVLFAWATRDRILQLRRSLPAIRRFPNARLVKFPAGHAPHLETPEAFARVASEFVASLQE